MFGLCVTRTLASLVVSLLWSFIASTYACLSLSFSIILFHKPSLLPLACFPPFSQLNRRQLMCWAQPQIPWLMAAPSDYLMHDIWTAALDIFAMATIPNHNLMPILPQSKRRGCLTTNSTLTTNKAHRLGPLNLVYTFSGIMQSSLSSVAFFSFTPTASYTPSYMIRTPTHTVYRRRGLCLRRSERFISQCKHRLLLRRANQALHVF